MEPLIIIAILGLLLAPLVLSIIALMNTGAVKVLRRRVDDLETELRALRRARAADHAQQPPDTRATTQPAPRIEPDVAPQVPPPKPAPGPATSVETAGVAPEPVSEPLSKPDEEPDDGADWSSRQTGERTRPAVLQAIHGVRAGRAPTPPAADTGEAAVPPRSPEARVAAQPGIDWERWIGVRGAAALGGILLGLAGLLFFKHVIDEGLITPTLRVILGTSAGLGAWAAAALLRRRDFRITSNALNGAGAVILYASVWAAFALYALIPFWAAFGLMALVTAACAWIAMRDSSQLVAVLGLIGGFATPLLLSQGEDRPIGLFGYVLLLNLGFLVVGRRSRFPFVAPIALLGTTLVQGLWIFVHLDADNQAVGLVVLAVFGALFLFAGTRLGLRGRLERLLTQVGGILFPITFAAYFAWRSELGLHLYPVGGLLAVLLLGAGWSAREQRLPGLLSGAASAAATVILIWILRSDPRGALAWELSAVAAVLASIPHLFLEWAARERGEERASRLGQAGLAATVAAAAFTALLILAGVLVRFDGLWPWIAGVVAIAALLVRGADAAGAPPRVVLAGLSLGLTAALAGNLYRLDDLDVPDPADPRLRWPLGVLMLGAPLLFHALAALRRSEGARRAAREAAFVAGLVVLAGLPWIAAFNPGPAVGYLGLGAALVVATAAAALGVASGARLAIAVVFGAVVHWSWRWSGFQVEAPGELSRGIALQLATVAALTLLPFAFARLRRAPREIWIAAACAGPLWFPSLLDLTDARHGQRLIGLLPLALAAVAGGGHALARLRAAHEPGDAARSAGLAYLVVAVGFGCATVPLWLDHHWIPVASAVFGAALAALWRRHDVPGLKWAAVALFVASTMRLGTDALVSGTFAHADLRILNWLSYTYLVPAAAMIAGTALLTGLEAGRLRPWETRTTGKVTSPGSAISGLCGIVILFAWINLTVLDWFETGETIRIRLSRLPARDLSLSITWAVYALVLLVVGMARTRVGLRWLSLGLFVLALGKVFLHDLGELEGLYRVGSLVGLAVSLLVVSVLYQRFVFGGGNRDTGPSE